MLFPVSAPRIVLAFVFIFQSLSVYVLYFMSAFTLRHRGLVLVKNVVLLPHLEDCIFL